MSNGIEVTDGRKRDIYINHELDDLGLDVYAFRAYGRLARRAGTRKGAFESIEEMAAGCRMSARRLSDALKELVALGLVTKTEVSGRPNRYHLTDKSEWRTPAPDAAPPTPAPDAEGSAPHAEAPAPGADEGKQGKQARKAPKTEEEERASSLMGFEEDQEPLMRLQQSDREAHRALSRLGGQLGWKFRHKNLAAARILSDRTAALEALTLTHKRARGDAAAAYSLFEKVLDDPRPEHRKRPPGANAIERDYSQDVTGADLLDQATSLTGRWN